MISSDDFDIVMSDLETDYEGQITRKSQVAAAEKCFDIASKLSVNFAMWAASNSSGFIWNEQQNKWDSLEIKEFSISTEELLNIYLHSNNKQL